MFHRCLILGCILSAGCRLLYPLEPSPHDTGLHDQRLSDQRDLSAEDLTSDQQATDSSALDGPQQVDPLKPFANIQQIPDSKARFGNECAPSLTADELTLFYGANTGSSTPELIERVARLTVSAPWSKPTQIIPTGTTGMELKDPHISLDGQHLWLVYLNNEHRIFRSSYGGGTFGPPDGTVLDLGSAENIGSNPAPSGDGLHLAFTRYTNNHDLWIASRSARTQPFTSGIALDELNTPAHEISPWIDHNARVIYFARIVSGKYDIFVATRTSPNNPFGPAVPMASVNTSAFDEEYPWISPDLKRIYFCRDGQLYTGER